MIIVLIFLIIIISALSAYIVANCDTNPGDIAIALFVCIILSVLVGALMAIKINTSEPTAIDVYRGNTTLEITYRDSIPIDSIVVFKNKGK